MIFFTILGVITFIYLLVGVATLGYGFYIDEFTFEEVREDPALVPFTIIVWPAIVLDELGLL